MTWEDITVWQWQQIELARKNKKSNETELDLDVKILCILKDYTESQVDSFSIKRLKDELLDIEFIHTQLPQPKAVDVIKANGKKYRCIFDIRNLPTARYLESKYFANDIVFNLHRIAASMVNPLKFTWKGFKVCSYDASKHEDYANDLLEAKFVNAYGSVVFFCLLLKNLMENSKDYLMKEMQMTMTEKQIDKLITDLLKSLDGYTKQPLSQSMKR